MTPVATLDDLRSGFATPRDALDVAARVLGEGDLASARRIYGALRAWIWKTLDGRRRDAELREWHDVVSKIEVAVGERFAEIAAMIRVLRELLYESISVSQKATARSVLRKRHVSQIVRHIHRVPGARLDRSKLQAATGLETTILVSILNLMQGARLLERAHDERGAELQLTSDGLSAARELGEKSIPVGGVGSATMRYMVPRRFPTTHELPPLYVVTGERYPTNASALATIGSLVGIKKTAPIRVGSATDPTQLPFAAIENFEKLDQHAPHRALQQSNAI